jgi:hypothetical protein
MNPADACLIGALIGLVIAVLAVAVAMTAAALDIWSER